MRKIMNKNKNKDKFSRNKKPKTRFEKILRSANVKQLETEKKTIKSRIRQRGKERRRKIRTYVKLNNLFKSFIENTVNKEDQQKFMDKFGHLLINEHIYTPYEKKLLSGIKTQKVIRRKRYHMLSTYKWQNLDKSKKSNYWDLFTHRKVKTYGSCSFVASHSKKIYTLKRVFRFFYGYLKNSVWKKAFYESKYKKNKLLHFLNFLENRLVVVLFRMNLSLSLMQAKQFIRHGFIKVNNRCMPYQNYQIKKNDIISVDKKIFLKFLIGNKTLPLNFMFSSVVKPELPHLYVKHRLLTGVFLYDPLNNYNILAKQYPSFFFGKNQVQYENINLHKITKNARNFKEHKDKKKFFDRIHKVSPFIAKYNELFANENSTVPIKNVRLILSYFLKV